MIRLVGIANLYIYRMIYDCFLYGITNCGLFVAGVRQGGAGRALAGQPRFLEEHLREVSVGGNLASAISREPGTEPQLAWNIGRVVSTLALDT